MLSCTNNFKRVWFFKIVLQYDYIIELYVGEIKGKSVH